MAENPPTAGAPKPPSQERAGSASWAERARSLRVLVIAVVGALLVLLLVTAGVTALSRTQVADAQADLRDRLLPAETAANDLVTAYVDEETGQRGFLLTGDKSFLRPYQSGQATVAALVPQLRAMVGRQQEAGPLIDQVERSGRAWSQEAAADIARRQSTHSPPARIEAHLKADKVRFDALRADLSALVTRTRQLSADQLQRISSSQDTANIVTLGAVVIAVVVAAVSIPVVRRRQTRPMTRLLGQVQAVAAGDYSQHIEATGPYELKVLAQAADEMRASIVENSERLVEAHEQLTLRDERDRVAADLHDLTIQRLFALGLSLSSRAARDPRVNEVVQPAIDDIDDIIRELRAVIFGLRREPGEGGLKASVVDLATESKRALGFLPTVHFTGPVDSTSNDNLTSDVLSVVREALSNVARHAHASSASVELAVGSGRLEVVVADNGVGLAARQDGARTGDGLRNMMERAARLGGTAEVGVAEGGGTRVWWAVPLEAAASGSGPDGVRADDTRR